MKIYWIKNIIWKKEFSINENIIVIIPKINPAKLINLTEVLKDKSLSMK